MLKGWLIAVTCIVCLAGCGSVEGNDDINPIIIQAYNSLSSFEKKELRGKWENASIKEERIDGRMGRLNDMKYEGQFVYIVVFYTGNHSRGYRCVHI